MNNETFCIVPFIGGCVRPTGELAACCQSNESSGQNYKNLITWFSDKDMTNLRKSLYSGTRHPWCSRCWQSQDLGQESLREIYNKNLIDDEILDVLHDSIANNFSVLDKIFFLDLKLGNLCNLKCLMCGPESSSSILSEWKNNSQWFNVGSLSNKDFIWPSEIDFKEKFFQYFSSLKYVKFTGGEPFLNPYIDDILETLPDTCIVHITTNLTRLDKKKLQLLRKFKNLWLTASIDAIEDLYEIIRYPASWFDVEKNIIDIQTHLPNAHLSFSITINTLSILQIDKTVNYLNKISDKINFIEVIEPDYMHLNAVNVETIDKIKKNIVNIDNDQLSKQIDSILNQHCFDINLSNKHLDYMEKICKIRKINFNKIQDLGS